MTNEISLLIASFDFLTLFEAEIRSCLRLGMHLVLLNERQEHMQNLLQDFKPEYYLYLVGKATPLSNDCLLDFTSRLYLSTEVINEDALLLVS